MKRLIPVLLILFLLCGCGEVTPVDTTSDTVSDYASQYLEYAEKEEYEFFLDGKTKKLAVGDAFGDFKLEKLLTRNEDDSVQGIRATFSCDITVTGLFTHLQNSTYGKLIRFYPPDSLEFPQPLGADTLNDWVVVLENNSPFEILGFDGENPIEAEKTVKITSFSINTSPNSTVKYIEIAKAEETE